MAATSTAGEDIEGTPVDVLSNERTLDDECRTDE